MRLAFEAEAIYWRGPAPFVYVPVPADLSAQIKAASDRLTYGWGCIPAAVTIGVTEYTTSLFPKEGRYLVPVKRVIQKAEGVKVGSLVKVEMLLGPTAKKPNPVPNPVPSPAPSPAKHDSTSPPPPGPSPEAELADFESWLKRNL
jgi:hypothetical protein